MLNNVTVTARARMHVTLIGMHDGGYRVNGGVGFSVTSPTVTIACEAASTLEIIDQRVKQFDEAERLRIQESILRAFGGGNRRVNTRLRISGDMPTHYGFGSTTAVRLSCLEAVGILTGQARSRSELVLLSKRGNTSGIGVNTFFDGGLCLDIGRKRSAEGACAPSSAESSVAAPLALSHVTMPPWKIGICIPYHIEALTETQERNFFLQAVPLNEGSVHRILYESIYGVLAAAIERDESVFWTAIERIQALQWKRLEWEIYGGELKALRALILECGAEVVGMSSLGPCLFFTASNIGEVVGRCREAEPRCDWRTTEITNRGREITVG